MTINKQKLPIYIALAIPVLMIVLVAGFVYFPGLGKKPVYDFVYVSGTSSYYYGYGTSEYTVNNGKLTRNPLPPDPYAPKSVVPVASDSHFYVYDVEKETAAEITFEQAQSYTLDASTESPDGYKILQGGYGGGFLFFDGPRDYMTRYLVGYNRRFKLNLKFSGNNDYYNFQFLGWVK